MKIRSGTALCLLLFVVFAGCKGFWNAPPAGGGGGGGGGTTLSSGVFYVLNQGTGQIVAYSIASGKLTKINSYNITGPTAIAIAPNKNFLYVSTLAGIYVYNIDSSGALTLGNNNQVISYDLASAITVDTSNSWLIDAFTNGSGQVVFDAIPLNSNGTYTSGANVPSAAFAIANATVKQMALSSDDANVFVALGAGGTLIVPFGSSNPFPQNLRGNTISVQHNQGSDLSVAVDPSNRLFYVGEVNGNSAGNSGGLRYFNYSTLAEVSGSPIASGGLAPNAILPLSTGSYVYVANGQGASTAGNLAWFPVTTGGTSTAPTYSLSSGSTVSAGIQPMGLAEDSTGNFVLSVAAGDNTSAGGNPDLDAYTISSGELTSALTSATGTDPVGASAIAALP